MISLPLILNKKVFGIIVLAIVLSFFVSISLDTLSFRREMQKKSSVIWALVDEGDSLSAQAVLDGIKSTHDRDIEFQTYDYQFIRTNVYRNQHCFTDYNKSVSHMGITVGQLISCVNIASLAYRGLNSTVFFLTFSMIQLFGLGYLTLSKSVTEKNLVNLINYLESDKSAGSYFGQKSELFMRIEKLVSSREKAMQIALEARHKYESQAQIISISKQVAHDIRSPLMALETALRAATELPLERRRLIEQANSRIKAIAEDLLFRSRSSTVIPFALPDTMIKKRRESEIGSFRISQSVERIVAEKKIAFPDVDFTTDSLLEGLKVNGITEDFERLLSNLLQNAIEATSEAHDPNIQVSLRVYGKKFQLSIVDNGKGIPNEVLSKIGEEGFTYGKSGGNGLGVSFAKRKVFEWDGDLQINSRVGFGTIVTITLPVSEKIQQTVVL